MHGRCDTERQASESGPAGPPYTRCQRDTRGVVSEPGLFPTLYLRVLLSQPAARPGDRRSLRVEGTDAGSLIRGKVLSFEQERDGDWHSVGLVVGSRSSDAPSRWSPHGSAPFAVTLEGYRATMPLHFDVPPILSGDYRIRLDATHPSGDGNLRQRTATLYAPLRILRSTED